MKGKENRTRADNSFCVEWPCRGYNFYEMIFRANQFEQSILSWIFVIRKELCNLSFVDEKERAKCADENAHYKLACALRTQCITCVGTQLGSRVVLVRSGHSARCDHVLVMATFFSGRERPIDASRCRYPSVTVLYSAPYNILSLRLRFSLFLLFSLFVFHLKDRSVCVCLLLDKKSITRPRLCQPYLTT